MQALPATRAEFAVSRPIRRLPDDPIKRSDYRAPDSTADRHFLGLIVAILSMLAVPIALALAYWALRR